MGDGQTIKIFHDAWLPTDVGRITTPQADLSLEATVAMLINLVSGWWNVQLIDRHFYSPDAKLIKSLPLCLTPQPDIMLWPKKNLEITL